MAAHFASLVSDQRTLCDSYYSLPFSSLFFPHFSPLSTPYFHPFFIQTLTKPEPNPTIGYQSHARTHQPIWAFVHARTTVWTGPFWPCFALYFAPLSLDSYLRPVNLVLTYNKPI